MKYLVGFDFTRADITQMAIRNCRNKGIFKKELLEEFRISDSLWRPFRKIKFFNQSDSLLSVSYIDEEMLPLVTDKNEQFLLWRPRYSDTEIEEHSDYDYGTVSGSSPEVVSDSVRIFLEGREKAKVSAERLTKKLKDDQSGYRAAVSFLLPRSPTSIRQHEDIAQEKRVFDGVLEATSLVLNMTQDDRPARMEVGERAYVETIIILYSGISDGAERMLALESPVSERIEETRVSGRALTRLLTLNVDCFNLCLKNAFSG